MKRPLAILLLSALLPSTSALAEQKGGAKGEVEPRVERVAGSDAEELAAYEKAVERYRERMHEFKADVRSYIATVESRRRQQVLEGYGRVIQSLREDEEALTTLSKARFERFLAKYPDGEYTPHVMFRLAEIYFEESENDFLHAQRDFDLRMQDLSVEDLVDIPEAPTKDYSEALALYESLVERYPHYDRIDGVWYMLGYCLTEVNSGQREEERGLAALNILVDHHPDSEFINDASMRLGEYYFDDNRIEESIPYYERIVESGDRARYYDKGLYKLAWSHYKLAGPSNLEEYGEALALFASLMDYSRQLLLTTGSASPMEKEAVEYMAISFADVASHQLDPEHQRASPVSVAERFFSEIGKRDYELQVFEELAETLTRQSAFEQAIEAYEYLQARWPLNPKNPEFQFKVARIYMSLPTPDPENSSRAQLVLAERYHDQSEWWSANRNNPDAQAVARNHIEKSLAQVATDLHIRAADTESPEDYSLAADKYREYLTRFPFADEYYEMEWYLADALFNANRMKEAEKEYMQLLKTTAHPYGDGSLYRLMQARRQILVDSHGRVERRPDSAILTRVEKHESGAEVPVYILTDEHKAFIEACDAVVEAGFTTPEYIQARREDMAALRYLPAQILFEFGHLEESRERFAKVIDLYPQTDEAAYSAALVVRSWQEEDNLENVRLYTRKYGRMSLGRSQEALTKLEDIRNLEEQAAFKLYYQLIEQDRRDEAVEGFLSFMDEFPSSPLRVDAHFNAANGMEILGRRDDANAMFELYINEYPTHERSEGLYFRIAENYAGILELDKAIRYYTELVRHFPESDNAPAALFNAAFLRIGMGDHAGAARDFEVYATRFSEESDAEGTFFRAGEQWEAVGSREALDFYRRYLKRYPGVDADHSLEAQYRITKILEEQGQHRAATREWDTLVAMYERFADEDPVGAKGRQYVAEAELRALLESFEGFQQIRFTGDEEKDARLLVDEKPTALERLMRSSLALIQKYQDFNSTSAALYVQAAAHYAYSDMLFNAPVPKGFNDEMEFIYRSKLDELRVPVEERGKSLALAALQKAEEASSWCEWQDETLKLLNRRLPTEYPREKMEERLELRSWLTPDRGPLTIELPAEVSAATGGDAAGEEGP